MLVPVLAIFAVCLANARAWIGRPFSGLLFLENGIVVSIGRAQWTHARYRNVPFSRILAVDGHPVAGGAEIHARVAARGIGATVTYTLRKGTEITRLRLPVRPFARADFLELFFPLLGVGFLMVVVGAAVVARLPRAPHAHALFALCLAIGLYLITGPDEYRPYRFPLLQFVSLCAIAPATIHLALAYPHRRSVLRRGPIVHLALYLPFVALGVALRSSMPTPPIFLPLLYTVYVFTANAALFYVGGLVLALIDGARPREPLLWALAAVGGSVVISLAIFVTYPLLQRPLSPSWLAGPLPLLPLLKGFAFVRYPLPAVAR